jgi:hypothetical protein
LFIAINTQYFGKKPKYQSIIIKIDEFKNEVDLPVLVTFGYNEFQIEYFDL